MILVVMAAGLGSRFGGLKQLTPVGPNGEFLIDYSVYDAIQAGIKKVVFVIKEEHQELFHQTIGQRIQNFIQVEYAIQRLDDLPIPLDSQLTRTKPWGTGQALLASRTYVDQPFMIINADDFYGRDAFQTLANFLQKSSNEKETSPKQYAMVAYQLKNTLSENGTVSRGICEVENGYLKKVTEKTKLGYQDQELVSFEEDGIYPIDANSLVSVNLFGFTKEIFTDANKYFIDFLSNPQNLDQKEFYLPTIVQQSINDAKASVKILSTTSKFGGMTYKKDLEGLQQNITKLIEEGIYPYNLWEEYNHEK